MHKCVVMLHIDLKWAPECPCLFETIFLQTVHDRYTRYIAMLTSSRIAFPQVKQGGFLDKLPLFYRSERLSISGEYLQAKQNRQSFLVAFKVFCFLETPTLTSITCSLRHLCSALKDKKQAEDLGLITNTLSTHKTINFAG